LVKKCPKFAKEHDFDPKECPSKKDAKEFFDKVDKNKDGNIDLKECMAAEVPKDAQIQA